MAPALFACPGCACHVRASEACCPLCGAELPRGGVGPVPRTAAAVAMGLAALASVPGCGDDTGGGGGDDNSSVAADYGSGPTGSGGSTGEGGAGATGATTTTTTTSSTGQGGAGGEDVTAEYGIGPTGGGSGG